MFVLYQDAKPIKDGRLYTWVARPSKIYVWETLQSLSSANYLHVSSQYFKIIFYLDMHLRQKWKEKS